MSIPFRQPATSSGVNAKLMSRTQDTSTKGRVDFENTENSTSETTGSVRVAGGIGIAKDLFLKGKAFLNDTVSIAASILFGVEINETPVGANADLDAYQKTVVILKNAGLNSIATIGQVANGKLLFLVNRTGNILILKSGSIDTGSADDMAVPVGGMVILMFIEDDSKWRVVSGGGGSGGGGGFSKIVAKTASGVIAPDEDCILVTPAESMTLTLPAGTLKEQHNFIRTDNVESRTVTIQCAGTDQILSSQGLVTSVTLPYQGDRLKLVFIAENLWGVF